MPLGFGLQSRRAQICRLYVLVVEETRRIAVIDDGAVLEDIAAMGDAERHMGVLLDQPSLISRLRPVHVSGEELSGGVVERHATAIGVPGCRSWQPGMP